MIEFAADKGEDKTISRRLSGDVHEQCSISLWDEARRPEGPSLLGALLGWIAVLVRSCLRLLWAAPFTTHAYVFPAQLVSAESFPRRVCWADRSSIGPWEWSMYHTYTVERGLALDTDQVWRSVSVFVTSLFLALVSKNKTKKHPYALVGVEFWAQSGLLSCSRSSLSTLS